MRISAIEPVVSTVSCARLETDLLVKTIDAAERFNGRPSDVAMDGLVRARSMEPLFV